MSLPKFLQPEAILFSSLEVLRARLTDAQPPVRIPCAWCPDFNGLDPVNRGASHGMCPTCAALFDAAIDADRANGDDVDDDREGEACSPACGHCGRCS